MQLTPQENIKVLQLGIVSMHEAIKKEIRLLPEYLEIMNRLKSKLTDSTDLIFDLDSNYNILQISYAGKLSHVPEMYQKEIRKELDMKLTTFVIVEESYDIDGEYEGAEFKFFENSKLIKTEQCNDEDLTIQTSLEHNKKHSVFFYSTECGEENLRLVVDYFAPSV